ncbi:adenylyl-sulfate kinase [Burkholderia sp. Ac-20379]|uniref:adenylyl-sulfate kinase n=1 Tax=Burkholderia sp. Ac-20379 TaxID=2703900 RepID=UPI001982080A|nr:adenylyl-sulfate kinase [Burkholderia sp. Ac-20379]MBN3724078.1 adenylyl-sulfate kinase [Burkholderia sp. Ac-20379]
MNKKVCGLSPVTSSLSVSSRNRGDAARETGRAATGHAAVRPEHRGGAIWLTGLSGAGKTTLAEALAVHLRLLGQFVVVLDGDRMRAGLNRDLGFGEADRFENVRRLAEVAAVVADAGGVAVVAAIAPLAAMRDAARERIGRAYREVHVRAPLGVCAARDPKGLYARAQRGELPGLTGVDAPYEPPADPDLVIDTAEATREQCSDMLLWFTLDTFRVRSRDAGAGGAG